MPGVGTALALYPSEDLAVVVLTNNYAGITAKMMQAIVGCVLSKYADAVRYDKEQNPRKPGPFTPNPQLLGAWTGTVQTWKDKVPFSMIFQQDGDIHVKLGEQLETLVNNASLREGTLEGRFMSLITTPDVNRYRHSLLLHLRLRGDKLTGQVIAETPDDSVHYALASYAELTRKTDAK
jgi:hypothetical protein